MFSYIVVFYCPLNQKRSNIKPIIKCLAFSTTYLDSTPTPTSAPNNGNHPTCVVGGACSSYEYQYAGYAPLPGSNCSAFCQCAPLRTNADGSVDYYWVRQPCAPGTLWSQSLLTCDHAANVQCTGMNMVPAISVRTR